jgi:hypothetical protein
MNKLLNAGLGIHKPTSGQPQFQYSLTHFSFLLRNSRNKTERKKKQTTTDCMQTTSTISSIEVQLIVVYSIEKFLNSVCVELNFQTDVRNSGYSRNFFLVVIRLGESLTVGSGEIQCCFLHLLGRM